MDRTRELIEEILASGEGDVNAYLSAVLRVRGELPVRGGRIECVQADSAFGEVIFDFINKARGIIKDAPFETGRTGGGEAQRFFFRLEGKGMDELLRAVRLGAYAEETNPFIQSAAGLCSFVRGLFAGGGTYTLPGEGERGYYMELRIPDFEETEDIRKKLEECGVKFESAQRRADSLLYTRKSEEICNMLAFMQAGGCAVEAYELLVSRTEAGRANRQANYLTSNIDKVMVKAARQVEAIEFLIARGEDEEEDGETKAIWRARLEHKTESAAYLAKLLGVSKSKVIRRLEKAIEKATQKGM